MDEWPETTRGALSSHGNLRLGCSGDAVLRELARELPWPLVSAAASRERPDERFESAEAVQQRCGGSLALIADA
ncbi:MAG: hypothetical protein KDA75_03180, partial [Planctomycetaceae bacterium]|nr:hypothetical protein [Planctomycetaceae bacterium]